MTRYATTIYERIFEPCVLLPVQAGRKVSPLDPQRALAVSVIVQAVRELQGKHAKLATAARRWFHGGYPCALSFRDACEWLEIDPDWLREKVLRGELRKLPIHGTPFPMVSRNRESSQEPAVDVFDEV